MKIGIKSIFGSGIVLGVFVCTLLVPQQVYAGGTSCKKGCGNAEKSTIKACKQQFSETKCGIRDRACKKRARKNKRQCIANAKTKAKNCVKGCKANHKSGRPTFDASVDPSQLTLSVNPQGGISGNRYVNVYTTRSQVGSGKWCVRIKLVDIVEGGSPSNKSLGSLKFRKKGWCYFTNKRIRIKPFADNEIRSICKNVPGTSQQLFKDALVVAHVTPWDVEYLDMIRRGETEGGIFPVPANTKQIEFAAKVNCSGAIATGTRTPPPSRTPVSACNMSNWWKLTTGAAGMGGEWKFSRTRSTQTQGKYSTRGPATSRNGRLNRGRGTGNATISSNKNFSWTINGNLTCKGRINNSCTVVTGQCRGKGYRAPKYSFRLEKSKGPVDISPKRNPAGNPTGVSTPSGTRSAPRRPGNTFKPRNPHLPPKPRW